jgi:hypothetical protein
MSDERIQLPDRYDAIGKQTYCSDKALHMDPFARAALETYRDSYQSLPTGGVHEFAAFFSKGNYDYLYGEIQRRAGNPIDKNDLFDVMMRAYSMILPRSDPMDLERRLRFDKACTDSYLAELNAYVFEQTVEEVVQANRQWDFYAQNRNGPSELPPRSDEDTRSRFVASYYPFDWLLPD